MMSHQFYDVNHSVLATVLILLTPEEYNAKQDLSELVQHQLAALQFGAKLGEVAFIFNEQGGLAQIYAGMGLASDDQAIAAAVMKLPTGIYRTSKPISNRAALLWSLAQYRYEDYQKIRALPRVLILNKEDASSIIAQSESIFLTRDLINAPPNGMTPDIMSEKVAQLAENHNAHFHEWVGDDLLKDNYPAIHAVGRASDSKPRLLSLTWGNDEHPKITLVGKGVCFDSGGLDIKNASAMRLMKKDMGGAAQVIGLAQWLMMEQLPIRLQVLIPAVENSIGQNAYRPGDVLTMRNGMTVEIDNTDAEGRLVLADALVKACEHSPELLIDFATLTGAARVAVGTELSALFCNDNELAEEIINSGESMGDPVWRMPLYAGYQNLLISSIADLANSSPSPYAGAIIAALFLQYFVAENVKWVHFDVMAWNVGSKPGKPEGGEAMGLLAVGNYLIKKYKK